MPTFPFFFPKGTLLSKNKLILKKNVSQFWGLWFLHSGQISKSIFFVCLFFLNKWLIIVVKYISPHFKVFLELTVFIALPACAEKLGNNMKPSLLGFHDNVVHDNAEQLLLHKSFSVVQDNWKQKKLKGYICHWDYKSRRGSELIIFLILQKNYIIQLKIFILLLQFFNWNRTNKASTLVFSCY